MKKIGVNCKYLDFAYKLYLSNLFNSSYYKFNHFEVFNFYVSSVQCSENIKKEEDMKSDANIVEEEVSAALWLKCLTAASK